jgi:hypothetical protein
LKKLAKGVAAIPVPGEKSDHQIHDKVLPDVLPDPSNRLIVPEH